MFISTYRTQASPVVFKMYNINKLMMMKCFTTVSSYKTSLFLRCLSAVSSHPSWRHTLRGEEGGDGASRRKKTEGGRKTVNPQHGPCEARQSEEAVNRGAQRGGTTGCWLGNSGLSPSSCPLAAGPLEHRYQEGWGRDHQVLYHFLRFCSGWQRGQLDESSHFRERGRRAGQSWRSISPEGERACVRVCECFVFVRGQRHAYLIAEWDAVIQSGLVAHRVGERRGARSEEGETLVELDPPPFWCLWEITTEW